MCGIQILILYINIVLTGTPHSFSKQTDKICSGLDRITFTNTFKYCFILFTFSSETCGLDLGRGGGGGGLGGSSVKLLTTFGLYQGIYAAA